MKSPITGKEMIFRQEEAELTFRKETFRYIHLFYECEDSGERFTTTELDTLNVNQVYNQYRVKYGIPFPDEIKRIRSRYGLSAVKMAEILGLGDNQYRLYENGDMPSEANGKTLSSIRRPEIFLVYVENARNQLGAKEYVRVKERIETLVRTAVPEESTRLIFDSYSRSASNGYAMQSVGKLKNVMLYLIGKCGPLFVTKMNKLLFYTDFLSYRTSGFGLTGLAYKAIQYGPVPARWDRVYSLVDDIRMEEVLLPSGNFGYQLCATLPPDNSAFTSEEREVLDRIVARFKDVSAADISGLSHEEDAWKHYRDSSAFIDFNEAFTLKHV
ncbi:type II toxin-antitoxin system antitoxin SocA domain-containing protein [uncultured Bacteroides sp.]|uniref:type II toxin-antitoxin system antitoxin SocA domain-containing protein n=1 Tax=uncultured Bacteroides sp. TaxID=162156 RepID=UPI002626938D|nr:type II toxin-antitoxin system antitoxin SocA domain-containing protein [uncultured Bacteroides sp.]